MDVESKAVNKILSSILHDTKKPFNNLKMFLTLLETKADDLQFLKNCSQSLLKDADDLFDFIRRLKEYFGPFKSSPETVIFKEIILRSFEESKSGELSFILEGDDRLMVSIEAKYIKHALGLLFFKSFELYKLKVLDKINASFKLEEKKILLSIIFKGENINNFLDEDKFLIPFFLKEKQGNEKDLNLSLCSKILQEFGCLLSFCKRQDSFEILVEIPLIT
jgi:hypothetical protein